MSTNDIVQQFIKDEERFFLQASLVEVARLMAYFQRKAQEAINPQLRTFFEDRVRQVQLYV